MATESEDRTELELRLAWDWFQYHAGQRLTAFNFFLILTGAALVGYTAAVEGRSEGLGIAIGVIAALVGVGFVAMDIRNTELVEYGRRVLDDLEKEELPRIDIRAGDRGRAALEELLSRSPLPWERWFYRWASKNQRRQGAVRDRITFTFWLRLIMTVIAVAFLLAAVWAAVGFPGA